jgi:pimeloyl-ACP methyl ester carboxylesterase
VLAEAGYRAVAPDQRGYSPRARPEGAEHYQVRHLVAVADWIGGHQVHLVGHDWGAAVAWQVAARYPQRLRTLTALSVPHPLALTRALGGEAGGDQAERSSYIDTFRTEGSEHVLAAGGGAGLRHLLVESGLSEDEAAPYVEALGDPAALRAALSWYRAMDSSLLDDLGPVTTPTLFVWSTDDRSISREAAELTAEHVAGPYRFEVLDGVTHWIPEQAPQALAQMLLNHLRDST